MSSQSFGEGEQFRERSLVETLEEAKWVCKLCGAMVELLSVSADNLGATHRRIGLCERDIQGFIDRVHHEEA